jgi:porin-like protein
MKMVKSLLLGSAAGLVAVVGAQAADLPVKAKPVEYVKVCSLYGAGFWYVPGTDTCLKIGSYIRVQTSYNAEGGGIPLGFGDATSSGHLDRTDTSQFAFRVRDAISVDLRTQTEYGTLRSYLEVGAQVSTALNAAAGANANTADAVFVDRGFIQFAGFTVGRIRSYFDINSFAPYNYSNSRISGDTGALGIYGLAYTAQFGNGVTASLSFEDGGVSSGGRGRLTTTTAQAGMWTNGVTPGIIIDNKGAQMPDVVGALRIDQAWGYAQVAGALHDVSGGYYFTAGACGAAAANCVGNGHPSDKFGWAATGGFTLNDVFGLKGDQVGMQAAYSQGAAGYVTRATGADQIYNGSSNVGFGWLSEGTYATGGSVELTTVWGINGFYQHFWNPKWRTSLYGGYIEVDYDSTATANICSGPAANLTGAIITGVTAVSNCSPNYSWTQVGTRTQWNPHPDLDIGVDVLWSHLNTAFKGTATLAASGAQPGVVAATIADQDVISVLFRVQRNFLP